MRTVSIAVVAVFVCLATAAFAQNYPLPAAVWEPAPVCAGCTGQNASGHLNNGLPTSPYGAPFVAHVGRVVDSTGVTDFMGGSGFATARARIARVVREQHGNVPPRIYIQIGSAIGVYSLDGFFTTALPGGMVSISTATASRVIRGEYPHEKVLQWDGLIHPESPESGWEITYSDGQDKLYDFDVDDRGIVYVATGANFGWGLVQDGGVSPLLLAQKNGYPNGGIYPDHIVAVKTGSSYFAVTSSEAGRLTYDVTSPSQIPTGTVKSGLAFGFRAFARDDTRERIAIVTMERKIEIYDNGTFVTGGSPLATFIAPVGRYYRDVTVDENGNFWTSETTNSPSSNKLVKLVREAGGYSQETFDAYGEVFTPAPDSPEGMATINYGDGYLTVTGRKGAGSVRDCDVMIFKIEGGIPVPVNTGGFFNKYYHRAPTDFAQPQYSARTMGAYPIRWNDKLYLLYNVQSLGDVYQFDDGQPVISSLTPVTGPPAGGTAVSIYGANFGDTPSVTIDGAVVSSALITPNRLDVQTPSHAAGVVDVVVSAGLSSSAPKSFTYVVPTPQNFIATSMSTTSVTATWSSVVSATQYELQRRQPDLSWLSVGTTSSLTLTESELSPMTAYFYRVRALDANGYVSSPSTSDFATTATFVGQTIVPGMSIQASHVNDVLSAINVLRAAGGLAPASFGAPVAAGTTLLALRFSELRSAVAQVRTSLAASTIAFTDSSLSGLPVKAIHLQELMDAVR